MKSTVYVYTLTISVFDVPVELLSVGLFEYSIFTSFVFSTATSASLFNVAVYDISILSSAVNFKNSDEVNVITKFVFPEASFSDVTVYLSSPSTVIFCSYVVPPIFIVTSSLKSSPFDNVSFTINLYVVYPVVSGTFDSIVNPTLSPTFADVLSAFLSTLTVSIFSGIDSVFVKFSSIATDFAVFVLVCTSYTK